MKILKSLIVAIISILIVSSIVYGVTYWVLTGQVEIIAGEGIEVYYDPELTEPATAIYDCGQIARGDTWINYIYVHNTTEESILMDAIQDHSDKIDIRLWWMVSPDQRVLQTEPMIVGANSTVPFLMEIYVLPTAEVGYWRWTLKFFMVE